MEYVHSRGVVKVALFSQEAFIPQFDSWVSDACGRGGLGRLMSCLLVGLDELKTVDYRCCMPLYSRHWKDPNAGNIDYAPYGPVIYTNKLHVYGRSVQIAVRDLFGRGKIFGIECPEILDVLYNDYRAQRWLQEIVLSRGGVAVLGATNFIPDVVWINDSHAAVAAANVQEYLNKQVKVLYTTHTQQAAAREKFYGAEWHWEDTGLPEEKYLHLFVTKHGECDLSYAISSMAHVINAVSREHEQVTKEIVYPMWAAKTVSVTNGVSNVWQLERYFGLSSGELCALSDGEIMQTHSMAREQFLCKMERAGGYNEGYLDRCKPWIGMIRRPAGYKNMYWPIVSILPAICADRGAVVRTHCGELEGLGLGLITAFLPAARDKECVDWMNGYLSLAPYYHGKMVYIPDYSFALVKAGVTGSDVWLEIPFVGNEGCGTSGRSAFRNGIPVISTMGGGNLECVEEYDPHTGTGNGFFMKNDRDPLSLYEALRKFSDLWYGYVEGGATHYVQLKRNALMTGPSVSIERCMEGYEKIFQYLTTPIL